MNYYLQVELINMDFTEQSIAAECQEDNDYSVVHSDLGPLSRGHWSRMSLPPRLSYLEGFLERARLYSGACKTQAMEDFDNKLSNDNSDNKHGNDSASSSLAASGDLDDNIEDFKDVYCDNEDSNINLSCVCSTLETNMQQQAVESLSHCVTSDNAVSIEIHLEDCDNAGQMEDTFAGFEIVERLVDDPEGSILTETQETPLSDLEHFHLQDGTAEDIHTEAMVILPD